MSVLSGFGYTLYPCVFTFSCWSVCSSNIYLLCWLFKGKGSSPLSKLYLVLFPALFTWVIASSCAVEKLIANICDIKITFPSSFFDCMKLHRTGTTGRQKVLVTRNHLWHEFLLVCWRTENPATLGSTASLWPHQAIRGKSRHHVTYSSGNTGPFYCSPKHPKRPKKYDLFVKRMVIYHVNGLI